MSTKRINALPAATSATDTSFFADEDSSNGNTTQKLSALQLYTYLLTKYAATPLLLNSGGTSASLTASNGGLFYSTATAAAILSGTGTAGQIPRSGSNAAPSWSTAIYPDTTTVNRILYSSSSNVIGEITTGNNGTLVTSAGGVPSISSTLPNAVQDNITRLGTIASIGAPLGAAFGGTGLTSPTTHGILVGQGSSAVSPKVLTNGQLLIGSTGVDPVAAAISAGTGITVTPGAGSITIATNSSSSNPEGSIYGLQQRYSSTTQTIMFPGTCLAKSGSNYIPLIYNSFTTMDITTNGVNGLDTGSRATDTWYFIWAIGDSTSVHSPAFVYSLNQLDNGPTLPAGYDVFRLVGCTKTSISSSNLLRYYFQGSGNRRTMTWDDSTVAEFTIYSGTSTSQASISTLQTIPFFDETTPNWIPEFQASLLQLRVAFTPGTIGNRIDVFPSNATAGWLYTTYGLNTSFPALQTFDINLFSSNAVGFSVSGVGGGTTSLVGIGFTFEV